MLDIIIVAVGTYLLSTFKILEVKLAYNAIAFPLIVLGFFINLLVLLNVLLAVKILLDGSTLIWVVYILSDILGRLTAVYLIKHDYIKNFRNKIFKNDTEK